ncbi:MAG: hypothetical protein IKC69_07145 [Clostridia bacterium]|nr:hypothetical protein [Clostridia bacterium]
MIEQDTVKLLRECDAGIRMGTDSIQSVLPKVKNEKMERILRDSLAEHERLAKKIEGALERFGDDGKEPNPIALSMSKMKTGVSLAVEEKDETVASLMTDGCNMGVKSLSRYLNEYAAADEESKDIAKKLISMEESLAVALRAYL